MSPVTLTPDTAVAPVDVEALTDAVVTADDAPVEDAELVETELLVEEVSIDGMCGVY